MDPRGHLVRRLGGGCGGHHRLFHRELKELFEKDPPPRSLAPYDNSKAAVHAVVELLENPLGAVVAGAGEGEGDAAADDGLLRLHGAEGQGPRSG